MAKVFGIWYNRFTNSFRRHHYEKLQQISITEDSRIELHDKLGLTGAEVSINTLPAGANRSFIHSHKNNEEIYAILDGEGLVIIDGEKITIKTGDFLRISPSANDNFLPHRTKE